MEHSRAFRFGVNSVTTSLGEWQDTARKAEALGYSTLIAQDHFGKQLAPLPSLVAAGAVTSTLRLATIVLDNDFRHPAVLAKEAATVDVLTNGRLELGIGAGWQEADYSKSGIPFDPPAQRMARLKEAVHICKAFFESDTPISFEGKHYRIDNLDTEPRPVQRPRPPIMIGGRQRRMLGFAVQEADIVGISLLDRLAFADKIAWVREASGDRLRDIELHVNANLVEVTEHPETVIEAAAQRTGRTVDEVRNSPATLVGSMSAIVEQLHARREQFGISYYVVQGRAMEAFAPVIARL